MFCEIPIIVCVEPVCIDIDFVVGVVRGFGMMLVVYVVFCHRAI